MPPRPKFDREEIINAAYEMARESGIEAVKARDVGERLGSSSRPIFTFFSGMDELVKAVKEKAWETLDGYLRVADDYRPAFKKRGLQFIRFANEEPKLYQMLFMKSDGIMSFEEMIKNDSTGFSGDIESIRKEYNLTEDEVMKAFSHMWIHAYGLCCFSTLNVCSFTDEKLEEILGETFAGIILMIKNHDAINVNVHPEMKGTPEGEKLLGANPALKK